MTYVDLNPIRAGIENDTYDSDFTSIQQRLFDYADTQQTPRKHTDALTGRIEKQQALKQEQGLEELPEAPLMPFDGSSHTDIHIALPFTREDYLQLVDVTGRIIRNDKRGYIPEYIPNVVSRLGIKPDQWIEHIQHFGKSYGACIGGVEAIADYAGKSGRHWCKGISHTVRCYRDAA